MKSHVALDFKRVANADVGEPETQDVYKRQAFHAALASAERAPLHAFDAGAEQGAQPDPDAHGKKADTVTVYEMCIRDRGWTAPGTGPQ